MNSSTAALMAMAAAFGAPDGLDRHQLVGQECPECRRNIGHAGDCVADASARFVMHCRDHPACRSVLKMVIVTEDGSGLCKRGLRLFEKAKALGTARDDAYAKTMGGRPGDPRR